MTRRDEIVDAALRLFAERGYAATTIVAIEEAAGFTPGAGGLYRHVRSKRELLDLALERTLTTRRAAQTDPALSEGDLRTAVTAAAHGALATFDADRDLYRLLLRGGDLPIDLDDTYDRLFQPGFDEVAAWLAHLAGDRPGLDAAAVASVALSSLCYVVVSELAYGRPPGGVDRERFVAAWVDGLVRQLEEP
ncbi:putative transcriptional regulator, TetR family protein [Pseudonocardia sulfidoxydans NBRC 16205]|uniref:Putative transcriptional regulator, TetR family protein n=1 Tax=Pseudonocardia sulfidoxydans NBRC 16205 TaxID=1223511 RepID=A0A511DFE0_9PSEU|nr:TetR/AcrR family transcriptional regulator [Pseudonocardia sulfidoxydans]GEL23509.1 putative transcriptional regulator, TetR family protein [Pseudonocardia sulfidoxydans NBRC 16205]